MNESSVVSPVALFPISSEDDDGHLLLFSSCEKDDEMRILEI